MKRSQAQDKGVQVTSGFPLQPTCISLVISFSTETASVDAPVELFCNQHDIFLTVLKITTIAEKQFTCLWQFAMSPEVPWSRSPLLQGLVKSSSGTFQIWTSDDFSGNENAPSSILLNTNEKAFPIRTRKARTYRTQNSSNAFFLFKFNHSMSEINTQHFIIAKF